MRWSKTNKDRSMKVSSTKSGEYNQKCSRDQSRRNQVRRRVDLGGWCEWWPTFSLRVKTTLLQTLQRCAERLAQLRELSAPPAASFQPQVWARLWEGRAWARYPSKSLNSNSASRVELGRMIHNLLLGVGLIELLSGVGLAQNKLLNRSFCAPRGKCFCLQ